MALLWSIMFKFQVSILVKEECLEEEFKHLCCFLEVRAQLVETAHTGQKAVNAQECDDAHDAGSEQKVLANLKMWAALTCPLWSRGGELDRVLL